MADNPYVNKVIYGGQTLIDISNDTVTATHLWKNVTAHDATGAPIIGSVEPTFGELTVYPEEAVQEFDITDYTGLWGWNFVTVDAVSATYVGSGVTRRTSTDLEASGPTVTAPAGYYASSASKTVTIATLPTQTSSSSSGSQIAFVARSTSNKYINIPAGYVTAAKYYTIEGVPTATLPTQPAASGVGTSKATISRSTSDQYINIPVGFVENSAYYKVSAVANMTLPTQADSTSSGTSKATIGRSTSDQYINIPVGYNATAAYYKVSAVANGSAGTPTATKGTVSNHAINVTPSVTNTTGYITGGTKTGTAVSVSASELVSGTKTISSNGTGIDVTNYASVDVALPEATLPTQTSSTSSGTSKASITRNTSNRYLNIPTGYVSTAVYYTIEGVPNATLPTATSSTSSGSLKATIARSTSDQYLNIPTGYVSSAVYYKFSAIPDCTLPTAPTSSGSGTRIATIEPSTIERHLVIPQGYVASQSFYTLSGMPSMTLPTNTSSTSSGTQKAVITPSSSDQYLNIPTGYNSTEKYYKINAAEDSTFVITLSWDSGQELWVPDKTYAEIVAANTAGKVLALEIDTDAPYSYQVNGVLEEEDNVYYYIVQQIISASPEFLVVSKYYYINSSGVFDDGEDPYYGTWNAVAQPTQVASGQHFYNASGYQTGSATIQTQLSTSGATVTAASGFYEASVSTTVQTTSLPTATSSTYTGTKKAEITAGSSVKYLNIAEGYQTGGYYQINAAGTIPEATLPTQTSSTSSGTKKATISRNTSTRYLNIPTGQISNAAYYEIEGVPNGSATTPTTTISVTPTISVSATGLVTASGTASQNITPTISAGYISSGTAGAVTASASNTYQLERLTATAYNVSTSDQTIAAGQYITGQQRFKGVVVSSTLTAANIKSGVTITVGDADNASRITSVTGTYSGGSGPALTLISTTSLGTLSTSSTSAADTSKSLSLASSTNFTNYDLLVVDISVNSSTNGRHTSSVSFIFLTGTSDVDTKNTYAVGSNVWNSKLSSSGVASTRQSTTKYGIYANSVTVSNNTMSIPIYYRYNSNYSGTINGSYTARVYGANLMDLIGG